MSAIPDNLASLHEHEESVRITSLKAISDDRDLTLHLRIIERAMDLLNFFILAHKAHDEDELTIQRLGIRLFNGLASALKLALSGYYQTAALQVRDVLEVAFLLDLFGSDRSDITKWREADKPTRMKLFSPVKVRTRLDNRDGYKERKRQALYDDLSELAGHATQRGFQLLDAEGRGAHCGPFFELAKIKGVLEDTANMAAQAGMNFRPFFPEDTKEALGMKLSFIEQQGVWAERFFGLPFDRSEFEEILRLADAVDLPSITERLR